MSLKNLTLLLNNCKDLDMRIKKENNSKNFSLICTKIEQIFKNEKEIISLYIYGSFLTSNFNPNQSDIDLLIIAQDTNQPIRFINKIKKILYIFKDVKLDINIVFLSEFKKRWHIYRPPSYFVGIKHQSKLLYGKDLIKLVKDSEITKDKVYKRIVDLAQASRGIYINEKDIEFWAKKYIKWLRVVVLEILFLSGEFDLLFKSGAIKFLKKFPELSIIKKLNQDTLDFQIINKIAESLRIFTYNRFIKK
ncbi:MAG: nucleotidyltransferase domain-containing protein [Patescibacteria group bacterium]